MAKEKRQKEEETVRCRYIEIIFQACPLWLIGDWVLQWVFAFLIIDAGTTKSSSADDAASDSGTAKSAK